MVNEPVEGFRIFKGYIERYKRVSALFGRTWK